MTEMYDHPTERELLACIHADPATLDVIAAGLEAEHFHVPRHALLFEAMSELHRRRDPIDALTLRTHLHQRGDFERAGGDEVILDLGASVPNLDAARTYAETIRSLAACRAVVAAAHATLAAAREPIGSPTEFVEAAEERFADVLIGHRGEFREHTGREVAIQVFESVLARSKLGGIQGIGTGLRGLDALLSGLERKKLYIVAGRPGMGKSALAAHLARVAVAPAPDGTPGTPTLFWSGEMGAAEIAERLLSADGGIAGERLRRGTLSQADWTSLASASDRLGERPIVIEDSAGLPIEKLAALARRHRATRDLGLLVVDYLQLLRARTQRGGSREQEVSAVARGLKRIAMDLEIPVVALAQLNRGLEARPDKRPRLSDLRESGAIEQDADAVIFVYRPSVYEPSADRTAAELIVAKQRGGRTGTVRVSFAPHEMRWADLPDPSEFSDDDTSPAWS